MIVPDWGIREGQPVSPFCERTVFNGMTFGLSCAGYDIRIDQDVILEPQQFSLASSFEQFNMPTNWLGYVKDKSSWARLGLAVQNTVIEPGWRGFLTLELTNHSKETINIAKGSPIAQIVFHVLMGMPEKTYTGKYQDQPRGPQKSIVEG